MIIHESTHQGSEQWDEWRAVRATASEFGKIFTGGGKVSGQREAYMRKCAVARQYKLPAWAGNEHTDRGTPSSRWRGRCSPISPASMSGR